MSYRTRVADSFARLSADQLVTMAGGNGGEEQQTAFWEITINLRGLTSVARLLEQAILEF
jgi:hypothetical protein